MSRTTCRTMSGLAVDLANPSSSTIRLTDIAWQLGSINRYSGATRFDGLRVTINVASHSLLVHQILLPQSARLAALGLLHDAHEAYLGDITTPARETIGKHVVERIARALDGAIFRAMNLTPPTAAEEKLVRTADRMAFAMEWRKYMPGRCPIDVPPPRIVWEPLKPDAATDAFLKAWSKLMVLLPGLKGAA